MIGWTHDLWQTLVADTACVLAVFSYVFPDGECLVGSPGFDADARAGLVGARQGHQYHDPERKIEKRLDPRCCTTKCIVVDCRTLARCRCQREPGPRGLLGRGEAWLLGSKARKQIWAFASTFPRRSTNCSTNLCCRRLFHALRDGGGVGRLQMRRRWEVQRSCTVAPVGRRSNS